MANWFSGTDLAWNLDWYGVEGVPGVYDGYGPSGVATLALDLKQGFAVTYRWITDIIKTRSGKEQRISRNDEPKQSFSGAALLLGDSPRAMRALMARYAAIGSQFLLGLPHEELTLRADAVGATIPVHTTANVDWAKVGQRVAVVLRTEDGVEHADGVIQAATANTIELDVAPGAVGVEGASIMPALAVYLEPQQAFPRYRIEAEEWELDARAAIFDFAPTLATLPLGPITASAAFDNVVLTSRLFGEAGNFIAFGLIDDAAAPNTGTLAETHQPGNWVVAFSFKAGVTTLGDLATALESSSYVMMGGTYNPADVIAAGDDTQAFFGLPPSPEAAVPLSGGEDSGDVGTGAVLTTYATHPVWDRRLDNDGTITDGVHAMTTIVDFGGKPYAIGTADDADWFRAVAMLEAAPTEWQWWKLFMWSVVGRQKAFWLPTWRDDLEPVSHAGATVTIDADVGDFYGWFPAQREHVQIQQADGTITYAKITAAVAGADTIALTLDTVLSASEIAMLSWLELCRWEADEHAVTFNAKGFSFSAVARVVQQ